MENDTPKTTDWQPIETAPKDGSIVRVRRVYKGDVIYDGPATWRTIIFPALPPDPLGRARLAEEEAYTATGWMRPKGSDTRVPEPTEWMPK